MISGVDRATREELATAARGLGAVVQSRVSHRTTVVVAETNFSLAALEGAVRGTWLVPASYLTDSAAANVLLPSRYYHNHLLANTATVRIT